MMFERNQRERLEELLHPSNLLLQCDLSAMEIAFLNMVAMGFRPKEMARQGKTLRAVQESLYRTRIKLGARTTTHAVYLAMKDGIIR